MQATEKTIMSIRSTNLMNDGLVIDFKAQISYIKKGGIHFHEKSENLLMNRLNEPLWKRLPKEKWIIDMYEKFGRALTTEKFYEIVKNNYVVWGQAPFFEIFERATLLEKFRTDIKMRIPSLLGTKLFHVLKITRNILRGTQN